ncbi:MAG: CooT family nickel-binding protein [Candidatus Adiutrix sp.]|jgi:predicted RNA-binding protein|nr:CooT family nickel-binding protein [Candidatus Adiutrix sp.]
MCEANVYLVAEGGEDETLYLEAVDRIVPEGPEAWRLTSIFGEQKTLSARLKSLNLVEHRIIFETRPA